MRFGWLEILVIAAIIVLVFGTGRLRALKNAAVQSGKALKQAASDESKE